MVTRRLTWLAAIFLLWGAGIFTKLLALQILHHREYAKMARARQELVIEVPAPRGTIFDRNGQPLAMSVPTESVYINPLKAPLEIAPNLLARALHLDRAELTEQIRQAYDNHRGFLWIKRKITYEEGQELRGMHLEWISIQKEGQRHYPNGPLAAHVLGSVDFEEKGSAGIEKALDTELRGKAGELRMLTDVRRRGIESQLDVEGRPGTPITLTLDEHIQFRAEKEIAASVQLHHAVSGSVVVMNPNTGDILAMASYPPYDPNLPPKPGEEFARQNHAVSVPFEPGSVYKVITLTAALETTNLTPDSLIDCHGGAITLFGRTIHDSHAGAGIMPMAMVLARSSNVGAIEVGLRVGSKNMYEYMRKMGFGQKTGITLPAESPGKVRKLSRWGSTSLASVSMGQEVSVTTLQLAQAAAIIANGGMLVHPRLILKKGDQTVPVEQPVRILRGETAITMRAMMEGVTHPPGTGTRARLDGYTVGGKTGSAQIYDFAARHYTHTYNGSFVGFSPVNNPQVVIAVTLNGTRGEGGFGGVVAGPVFHDIGTEVMRVLDVPKDILDEPDPKMLVAKADQMSDLADPASEEANILEDGEGDDPNEPDGPPAPRVPDFKGKTMRVVLAEAAAQGLTVLPNGSGVARVQVPAAGAVLHDGERIRVQFSR